MPSRTIISGAYEAPSHDWQGQRILRDLIACIEQDSNNALDCVGWVDMYTKYRFDKFFMQRYTNEVIRDLRHIIQSVRRRDRRAHRPNRHRRETRFLNDICNRYEGQPTYDRSGPDTVLQKMDADLRDNGQPRYPVSWDLWNEFCRCIKKLQRSDRRYNGFFGEINRIPEAMIDQFYEEIAEDRARVVEDESGDDSEGEDNGGEAS